MSQVTVSRNINASVDLIFRAVSDIINLPFVNPDVVKVEFLSNRRSGVGTRFRETRTIKGKESKTELEVTEYVENDHIRMVAESHGSVWDSVFVVKADATQNELKLIMDAKGQHLLPKLMNFLLQKLYQKGLEKHMDAVKLYCEKQ